MLDISACGRPTPESVKNFKNAVRNAEGSVSVAIVSADVECADVERYDSLFVRGHRFAGEPAYFIRLSPAQARLLDAANAAIAEAHGFPVVVSPHELGIDVFLCDREKMVELGGAHFADKKVKTLPIVQNGDEGYDRDDFLDMIRAVSLKIDGRAWDDVVFPALRLDGENISFPTMERGMCITDLSFTGAHLAGILERALGDAPENVSGDEDAATPSPSM